MFLPLILAATIQYPIPTLDNCNSQQACKFYCEIPWHYTVCETWAKGEQNVLGEESINISFPIPELGNCTSKEDCKQYCEIEANYAACQAWAKSSGVEPPTGEQQDKPVDEEAASLGITFPIAGLGNCGSKQECMAYCDLAEHRNECNAFAEEHGLDKQGGPMEGPGGCKGPSECESYCQQHSNECFEWAKAHGMEGEHGGPPPGGEDGPRTGPGGCNSPESCDAYCKSNQEECMQWGEENGMKTGERPGGSEKVVGPGGCDSEESCRTYCEAHPQECGAQMPGEGMLDPDPSLNPKEGEQEGYTGEKQTGPGGCTSQAECEQYCMDHPAECGAPDQQPGNSDTYSPENNTPNTETPGDYVPPIVVEPTEPQPDPDHDAYCQMNPQNCQ